MIKRDLVAREDCAAASSAAAPKHVATVRRLVIDVLAPEELATLGRLSARILERLDAESA